MMFSDSERLLIEPNPLSHYRASVKRAKKKEACLEGLKCLNEKSAVASSIHL